MNLKEARKILKGAELVQKAYNEACTRQLEAHRVLDEHKQAQDKKKTLALFHNSKLGVGLLHLGTPTAIAKMAGNQVRAVWMRGDLALAVTESACSGGDSYEATILLRGSTLAAASWAGDGLTGGPILRTPGDAVQAVTHKVNKYAAEWANYAAQAGKFLPPASSAEGGSDVAG